MADKKRSITSALLDREDQSGAGGVAIELRACGMYHPVM